MDKLGDTFLPPAYKRQWPEVETIKKDVAKVAAAITGDSSDAVVASRGDTHGLYDDTARVAQLLKNVMHGEKVWHRLDVCQREALDMIATKIGRILGGNPNFKDHWTDLGGYARLVEQRCK